MAEFFSSVGAFLNAHIWEPITGMTWKDGVDILLLAVLLYFLYTFVSGRRASKLLFGLATIVVLYILTDWVELRAAHWLLSSVASFGVIVLAVIFQPELRDALDKLGSTVMDLRVGNRSANASAVKIINEVVEAACQIAQQEKDGALIVIEGSTRLGEFEESGVALDALASSALLTNIFVDRSPLHDGAVIIRGERVVAAGCKLSLTSTERPGLRIGTRHRAALGVSEQSDCVVVVVSEERHVISLVNNGCLKRDYNKSIADFSTGEKDIQNRLRADLYLLVTGSADPTAEEKTDKHDRKKFRFKGAKKDMAAAKVVRGGVSDGNTTAAEESDEKKGE